MPWETCRTPEVTCWVPCGTAADLDGEEIACCLTTSWGIDGDRVSPREAATVAGLGLRCTDLASC